MFMFYKLSDLQPLENTDYGIKPLNNFQEWGEKLLMEDKIKQSFLKNWQSNSLKSIPSLMCLFILWFLTDMSYCTTDQ